MRKPRLHPDIGLFWINRVTQTMGFFSALVGIFVILVWHVDTGLIRRFGPDLSLLEYYTAIGLFVAGLGLIQIGYEVKSFVRVLAAILVSLSFFLLLDYYLGFSTEIAPLANLVGQLPFYDAARISPLTSICLFLTGLNLFCLSLHRHSYSILIFVKATSSVIVGLGLIGLLAYVMGLGDAGQAGPFAQLALHSTTACVLLGTGLLAYVDPRQEESKVRQRLVWIPLPIGLGLLALIVAVWQVSSTNKGMERMGETFPETVLAVGTLIAALVTIAINLAQTAIVRSHLLEALNTALKREMEEKEYLGTEMNRKAGDLSVSNNELIRQQRVMISLMEDLQRSEKALKESATALARSNNDLEQFAYIASHDLQEPLRKITAFGQRLKEQLVEDAGNKEELMDYVQRIGMASDRMKTLINDILQFSRVTTRGLAVATLDLNEVVKTALDDLVIAIQESGATFRIDPLPKLRADHSQMHQLFLNLIGNAIKFRKKGVAPVIQLTSFLSDHFVILRVTDNGIGFEVKYAKKIFQPFQRLHSRVEYSGSGIGLAVCQKIVERHGGEILVDSELDRGTTFDVKLPLASVVME